LFQLCVEGRAVRGGGPDPERGDLDFAGMRVYPKAVVARQRIDSLLVSRGLVESTEKARAMVMGGAALVPEDAEVRLVDSPPFVSRGGLKLDRALDEFGIDVSGMVVVDVGASTGGFTDCLLKRGASKVYAVDVGYGQLDYGLRQDARVVVMERVNARYPLRLPERVDLATLDLSFISLQKVVPAVADVVKDGGRLIALVKPQFEAARGQVGRGGVVREARVFRLAGLTPSPILGAEGNREFFVSLQKPEGPV